MIPMYPTDVQEVVSNSVSLYDLYEKQKYTKVISEAV